MKLLQRVRLIDPVGKIDRHCDVLIEDNRASAIADEITEYPDDIEIISGEGLILGTGLVDLYSHSGEPGNEARESLSDLAKAAAAGGFTQIGVLPDTLPGIDRQEVLAGVKQKARSFSGLHFWGAVQTTANDRMNELAELRSGVIGFCGEYNLANLGLFKQVVQYIRPWGKTLAIALNCHELAADGVVREGSASIRYGMPGNPRFSESAIIAAILEIVAEIPTPIHIMRVSTERGVELIGEAKAKGMPVTASTTWMHLLWNSDAVGSYDPNLRLEPPLGEQKDQSALIAGIKQGTIDAIAIDHQAYTYEEKTVPFGLAPPGVVGLEIALPLLWQKLVESKKLSPLELWQALSSRPLGCWQQQPKSISSGQKVDLILFDPQKTWLANRENLQSPASNTPYYGQQITGKVITNY